MGHSITKLEHPPTHFQRFPVFSADDSSLSSLAIVATTISTGSKMPPPLFKRGDELGEGLSLNRWKIIRKVGEGQFAEVYEVADALKDNKRVSTLRLPRPNMKPLTLFANKRPCDISLGFIS